MHSLWALVVVCFVEMASAQPHTDNSCDFMHLDLEGAVDKLLAKLPEYHLVGPQSFGPVFPGLEIGGMNISGLNKVKRYGPLLPYCMNGTRMLQLDLINSFGTALSSPWRYCSGSEGNITLLTELTRLTTQFRVSVSESSSDVVLSYEGPTIPVTTEGLVVVLEGAGDIARKVTATLSLAFRGFLQHMSAFMFYRQFGVILQNAIEENSL